MNVSRLQRASKLSKSLLPPGQFLTEKFPVLSMGATPHVALDRWRFRVFGLVATPVELTWQQFMELPQVTVAADFHCVTQWSRLSNIWQGISSRTVLDSARVAPEARYVMVHCYGGYTTNLDLAAFVENDVLFAHYHDGQPLAPDHGGPLRLVVPRRYGWKSAKWANGLELMAEDRPGFWEQQGYHHRADPWREERFWEELL